MSVCEYSCVYALNQLSFQGCEHRAIHLVDANGEVVDAGEVQSSTLRESFGLSLKADSDQALC